MFHLIYTAYCATKGMDYFVSGHCDRTILFRQGTLQTVLHSLPSEDPWNLPFYHINWDVRHPRKPPKRETTHSEVLQIHATNLCWRVYIYIYYWHLKFDSTNIMKICKISSAKIRNIRKMWNQEIRMQWIEASLWWSLKYKCLLKGIILK